MDAKFHFKRSYVESMDKRIKTLSDRGVLVSLIVLTYQSRDAEVNRLMIHPDCVTNAPNRLGNFNTVTEDGRRWLQATMEFCAERWSRPDKQHGRVVGYIMGNEVNSHWWWANMGARPAVPETGLLGLGRPGPRRELRVQRVQRLDRAGQLAAQALQGVRPLRPRRGTTRSSGLVDHAARDGFAHPLAQRGQVLDQVGDRPARTGRHGGVGTGLGDRVLQCRAVGAQRRQPEVLSRVQPVHHLLPAECCETVEPRVNRVSEVSLTPTDAPSTSARGLYDATPRRPGRHVDSRVRTGRSGGYRTFRLHERGVAAHPGRRKQRRGGRLGLPRRGGAAAHPWGPGGRPGRRCRGGAGRRR